MTRAHGKYALVADEEGIKENSGLRGPTRKRLAVLLTVVIFGFGAILLLIAGTERRGPSVLWLATENGEGAPNSGDEHAPVGNSAHADASIAGRGEETVETVETVETDFRLTTWPSLIEDGGDLVVFWHGAAETPLRKEDYITLSCGPTLGDHDYFRLKSVTEIDASDNSVRFSELYMMRCNYTAVYFSYQLNSSSFKAIARIEVGMRESFATPKHGHLSLTTEASEMVIMFNSASSKTPVVRYGETAQDLSLHATGMSATYSANDMPYMYSTQLGMEPEMKVASHFRDEVEDLIHKHRVNLMMVRVVALGGRMILKGKVELIRMTGFTSIGLQVGHQHAYERSCPVYRKECVPDGKATVHVVAGSAGYPLDTADFSTKYGNWSIRHVNEYGYLRIMSDPEIMRVQFVLNKNGNVYDEFTITPWE
ncbi:hypothetical protein BBJ28_00003323 [Nothophytophthora sp. Chile5]|nr:hypothetical protein BBJ28_00003323 [Nothophytophthora sp. Chile5]